MIKRIYGTPARFCDTVCAAGFREDRRAGVCYGLHKFNGVICKSREEYSLAACRCAYCDANVPGQVTPELFQKFYSDSWIPGGVEGRT